MWLQGKHVFDKELESFTKSKFHVEGRVLKLYMSHKLFAARKKQQVETTRATPNLVLRRVKEEPRQLPGEELSDRTFPNTEFDIIALIVIE